MGLVLLVGWLGLTCPIKVLLTISRDIFLRWYFDSTFFRFLGGIYHNEQWSEYHSGFGQGSIVGVHIDLWRGRISYHINRKLIGKSYLLIGQFWEASREGR